MFGAQSHVRKQVQCNGRVLRRDRSSGLGEWRAMALAVLLALPGGAQNGPTGGVTRPLTAEQLRNALGNLAAPSGDADPVQEAKRVRAFNADRQKSMVADADRLLKLARALSEETTKADPGAIPGDQLRTVAEIEKLAHNVKQKMSDSYPVNNGPAVPQFSLPFHPY